MPKRPNKIPQSKGDNLRSGFSTGTKTRHLNGQVSAPEDGYNVLKGSRVDEPSGKVTTEEKI